MNKKKILTIILSVFLCANTFNTIALAKPNFNNISINTESDILKNILAERVIPKSNMTATATASQAGEDGSKAIDGNISTLWHTPWNGSAVLPQSLNIKLDKSYDISSIRISPRNDGGDNGKIRKYEIYSGDEKISEGQWDTSSTPKTVRFDKAVTTDSLTVKVLEGVAGYASIAEVDVYEAIGEVNPIIDEENLRINNGNGLNLNERLEDVRNLEEGTIIARFDLKNTGIQSIIGVSNNTVANHHFNLWTDGSRLGYEIRNASGNTNGTASNVVLNQGINTIAFKVEKNVGYSLYLNGERVLFNASSSTKFLKDIPNLNAMDIGKTDRSSGSNEYLFTGDVDFIDMYATPISEDYIIKKTAETAGEELPLPEGAYKSDVKELFTSGDLGSNNFRIPSIITTKNGTMIAASDVRNNHGGDSPANIDAGVVISKDGGQTWVDQKRVIDYPGYASVIDASMLQDEETGKVFLFITAFPQNYGFPQAQKGSGFEVVDGEVCMLLFDGEGTAGQRGEGNKYYIKPGGKVYTSNGEETAYTVDTHNNLYENDEKVSNTFLPDSPLKAFGTAYLTIIESSDDGDTWSDPKIISGGVKEDWMKFIGTGPGVGIQIENGDKAGRLVFPLYYTNEHGFQSSAVMYSDDHGVTWELGESPNDSRDGQVGDSDTVTSGNQLTEAQVVQMPDGQLKMFMRNTGSYVRIATSFDGGETWEGDVVEDRNLIEPYCQLSVINYSEPIDGKPAVIFSNPNANSRSNGTVRIGLIEEDGQYDNGRTRYNFDWEYSQVVKEGGFAYSSLTEMPNGNIGLLYENNTTLSMDFIEMNLEFIKADLLADAPAANISNVSITDEVDGYKVGDKVSLEVTFDQAVSIIGNRDLTITLGDYEVPLTLVENINGKSYTLEGVIPEGVVVGDYNVKIKAQENIDVVNVNGKNTDMSNDIETNLNISIISDEVISNGMTTITTPEMIKVEDTFDIKLGINELKEDLEAYSAEFTFTYNPEIFKFNGVSSISENVYVQAAEANAGEVRILVASLGVPIVSPSDLVNVNLTAKKEAIDETLAVTVSQIADGEGDIHELEVAEKVVTVEGNDIPEEIIISKIRDLKAIDTTDSSTILTWTEPEYTVGLVEYVVYKDGKEFATVPADATELEVTGLRKNTIYGFKIVAKYSNEEVSRPTSINIRTKK